MTGGAGDALAANPGGPNDPLGESVLDEAHAPWRVWEPREVRVVIGRGQDAAREVDLARCAADGVPVHRRLTGGGAVVLAPGMVVVALRLPGGLRAPDDYFAAVNARLIPAVAAVAGIAPACRGHGDLTMPGTDGAPRKILGASLRQNARLAAYLGVLLVADAVPLMERYLAHPSREPGYRAGRTHRDFCIGLGAFGVTVAGLRQAVAAALAGPPLELAACPAPRCAPEPSAPR